MPESNTIAQRSPASAEASPSGYLALVMELTKARLVALVMVTALAGYLLAPHPAGVWSSTPSGHPQWLVFLMAMLGTALAGLGANAFNQWLEYPLDARMHRTRARPIPSGRLTPSHAFRLAIGMMIGGPLLLACFANLIAAGLAAAAALIYIFAYTPMKRRSTTNTLLGAVCGGLPPMIGWAAATGTLSAGAYLLGILLFVWQIPHFLALAWMYRSDYARGGFCMLPVADQRGRVTCLMILLYTLALLPLGLAGTMIGLAGWTFAIGATVLGLGFFWLGVQLYLDRSEARARRVFLGSLAYLPLLLVLMLADRGPADFARPVSPAIVPSLTRSSDGEALHATAVAALPLDVKEDQHDEHDARFERS